MKPTDTRSSAKRTAIPQNEMSSEADPSDTAGRHDAGTAVHERSGRAAALPVRQPRAAEAVPPRSAALRYYEAIERASADMLSAARGGDWDAVVKLEGACALLISQLKHAAAAEALDGQGAQLKSVIMQRILLNDAEIRHLAEPWLDELDNLLSGRSKTLH